MAVTARSPRRRYLLLLLVLTAVTLVTLDQRRDDAGPLGFVGEAVHEVVGPVRRAVDAAVSPARRWLDRVTSTGNLESENAELRRRLAQAEAQAQRAQDAIRENRDLKTLLDLEFLEGIDTITARLVGGPVGNFEETVFLDKGERAGIRVGMPVVAGGGLFGRVVEVSPSQAKVLLVTDERMSVRVRSARDRLRGIVTGHGGSSLRLEFVEGVDDDAPRLVQGDALVTGGDTGSRYPVGIPVGSIRAIDQQADQVGVTAVVAPSVDFAVVEYVQVLDWDPARDEALPVAPPNGGVVPDADTDAALSRGTGR